MAMHYILQRTVKHQSTTYESLGENEYSFSVKEKGVLSTPTINTTLGWTIS